MDITTAQVMLKAHSLYKADRDKRVSFGQDTGPEVTFVTVTSENAQYVHDACLKLGHKCACAPSAHDQPATFDKGKSESKRVDELLAASPLGREALADRKNREENEAAKFAAQVVRPIDKYLELTPTGRAVLDHRKNGGKS